LTNGIRLELHHQSTLVVAVHASFIDTDMAAMTNAPKDSPRVGRPAGIRRRRGRPGRGARRRADPDHQGTAVTLIYPPLQKFWDDALKGGS
jgi:hypothetical protein